MKCLAVGIIIGSMALRPTPVKAQTGNLPTANNSSKRTRNHYENSGKETNGDWARLIAVVKSSGQDFQFIDGYAQAIGLPGPLLAKRAHVSVPGETDVEDDRDIEVVMSSPTVFNGTQPQCVYLHRGLGTKSELKLRYYRVNLKGELEMAITLQNKRNARGENIRESRERLVENTQKSEVQKAFRTEMDYWLKVWLKKQAPQNPSAKN